MPWYVRSSFCGAAATIIARSRFLASPALVIAAVRMITAASRALVFALTAGRAGAIVTAESLVRTYVARSGATISLARQAIARGPVLRRSIQVRRTFKALM